MDHVHEYGKDVLTMGLLLLEFKDLIRYGDGERPSILEGCVSLFSSNRSYKLYIGSIQLAMSLLLLAATSLCRATDMELLREYTWLLW